MTTLFSTLFMTSLAYLICYMPENDKKTVTADYLVKNTQLAIEAYENSPWKTDVPVEIFLEYILPYSSMHEDVEEWRQLFSEKCKPLVKDCKTTSEAALMLNKNIWKMFNVIYSTKRDKHDQAPLHSIRINKASCTGLSIMLVDACRAVGVPARTVGCIWAKKPGNHTWVEIYDKGAWNYIGAFDGSELNNAWFTPDAQNAVKDNPEFAIYASAWKPTGTTFYNSTIPAHNVTKSYLIPSDENRVKLSLTSKDSAGSRIAQKVKIIDKKTNVVIFEGFTHTDEKDLNNHLTISITKGAEIILFFGDKPPQKIKMDSSQILQYQ